MVVESPVLSVIVPTLNEAENIEGIVRRILAGGSSLSMEIIVVDDGSKDDTQAIVRRLSDSLPVTLLPRDRPKDGLAGAVLAGARAARAGVVMVIDADGSHPPEKIPELAEPVIAGAKDMIIGSRYAPGGSTPGWSRKRRLMSRAASAAAWPLTDVHDALSGFFAVRRELLASIPSDAAGFKIALEILVRGGDTLRVGEVPIAFKDRELGQSKMGAGVILTYFRRLLALSGWRESRDTVGLGLAKGLLVWVVDFVVFAICGAMHWGLGNANLAGFAVGAGLNVWLKSAQRPRVPRNGFLARLLFVSLLAFFLRSGVLGTCAEALGWPRLASIVPAIMAGWVTMFLGYALFIWPVREQYGRGVRWRVAAMGASAYLLALRVAYLYALPIDKRLAAIGAGTHEEPLGNRLAAMLRSVGTTALGPGRAGFNVPALLCWAAGAWAVFATTRRIFDKTSGFRALLLFSALPVFFWTGAVFGPVTVLITLWAVLLWGLSYTLRLSRGWEAALWLAVALAVFWMPAGGWLPKVWIAGGLPGIARLGFYLPWQVVLVTPVTLLEITRCLRRWARGDYSRAATGAGICAAVAGVSAMAWWTAGALGLMVSGAMWLPLLPFVAAEMHREGDRRSRSWEAVLYLCVVCYGAYFYWLGYGG